MPVATQAALKGLTPQQVEALGASLIPGLSRIVPLTSLRDFLDPQQYIPSQPPTRYRSAPKSWRGACVPGMEEEPVDGICPVHLFIFHCALR